MKPIVPKQKLTLFKDHWNPRVIAELNGQQVKVAKLKGDFVWHSHDEEDELFYVLKGTLKMEFEDRTEVIPEGEFIVVPRKVKHRPIAEEEVHIMLFEPASTINTGDADDERRRDDLDRI